MGVESWDFRKIIEGGIKIFLQKWGVVHIGGAVYRRWGASTAKDFVGVMLFTQQVFHLEHLFFF